MTRCKWWQGGRCSVSGDYQTNSNLHCRERKRSQDMHFHRSQLRSQLLVQLWFYRSLFFSRLLLPQVHTCNPWDLEPSCHLHHKATCKSQHTQSTRGSCYQDTSVQHKLCLNSCYLLSFSFLLLSCHMSYSSHACNCNQRAGDQVSTMCSPGQMPQCPVSPVRSAVLPSDERQQHPLAHFAWQASGCRLESLIRISAFIRDHFYL